MIGYPPELIAVFLSAVVGLLALDFYMHRDDEVVSFKSAVSWSLFYVAIACGFGYYVYLNYGSEAASAYMTGYTLEKVLAFDNLFVFSLIFAYFKIPDNQQHKALYWGIGGAIVFRLIFVVTGVGFMEAYGSVVELIFAGLILWSVYLIMRSGDDTNDFNNSWYVKGIRKIYPAATPLVLAIVTIEFSDVLFSFDSVPAIIAITKDPLLIYSAMIFAILGLRSMYFIISSLARYFVKMDDAIVIVLTFIAVKLVVNALFDIHIDSLVSLAVILSILAGGVVASLIFKEQENVL